MIVNYFDIERVATFDPETHPPRIVNADTPLEPHLSFSRALQTLEQFDFNTKPSVNSSLHEWCDTVRQEWYENVNRDNVWELYLNRRREP